MYFLVLYIIFEKITTEFWSKNRWKFDFVRFNYESTQIFRFLLSNCTGIRRKLKDFHTLLWNSLVDYVMHWRGKRYKKHHSKNRNGIDRWYRQFNKAIFAL
jgi:hypothetical protein